MSLSKTPYRGTRDFFPAQKRERDYLFATMTKIAHRFGYESYDGPLLEEVELYKAKSGEELINEQIYSFVDRGERFVAIRPEMTPTLARMVAQIHRETPKPIRWFSLPNLMRYEKPQRGRLREHWQLNCDLFGGPAAFSEAEVLSLLVQILNELGATQEHFEILINDRRIVDGLFQTKLKLEEAVIYRLYKIIDKSKKVNAEALTKMISELQLSTEAQELFQEYLGLKTIEDLQAFLKKTGLEETAQEFQSFWDYSTAFGVAPYLQYDPTIVRGLDYYTGIVFEAFDKNPENRRALCGGGAYSSLLKIFNEEPVPGVGFGLGDVTLTDFLKTHKLMPDLSKPVNDLFLSCQDEAGLTSIIAVSQLLRKRGLNLVVGLEAIKMKKVFSSAEKAGAAFVGLMGSDEITKKELQLKNLATGEQKSFALNDCDGMENFLKG